MEGEKHFYLVVCLVLVSIPLSTAINSTCQVDHVTRYLLTFLVPGPPTLMSPDDAYFRLVLTNPSNTTPVEIRIEPGNLSLSLQPGKINSSFVLNGSSVPSGSRKQIGDVGLLVTAKHCDHVGLLVQGIVRTKIPTIKASAAFTVPPTTSIGTDYVVVTHCEHHHCFMAIVASRPDTHIHIMLRLRHARDFAISPTLVYNGKKFEDGDVLREELEKLQVMQILCKLCDMSGSHVTASSPVALLAGGEYTTLGNSSNLMDTVLEFLPPKDALGTRYVVAKDKKSTFVVKVVAFYGGTQFTIPVLKECYTANSIGDTWVLPLPQDSSPTVLVSTHPMLVSLFITNDPGNSTDARMIVLQPPSQWDESYHVVVPFNTKTNHLFLVANHSEIVSGCICLNGDKVCDLVEKECETLPSVTGFSELSVVRVLLNESVNPSVVHCCSGCNCKPFGGYVEGVKKGHQRGWAMPLGPFRKTPFQTNEVPAVCKKSTSEATSLVSSSTSTTPRSLSASAIHMTSRNTLSTFLPLKTSAVSVLKTTMKRVSSTITPNKFKCPCKCRLSLNTTVITQDPELAVLLQTSSQRNRKMSAPDKRVSATVMGSCGVIVLVAVSLVIVCSDLVKLLGVYSAKFDFTRKRQFHHVAPQQR